MRNLCVDDLGASIEEFTSQYHHESRCLNLLKRDPGFVWFTHVTESLPQHVIMRLRSPAFLRRVGIYLHGENNQNPRRIAFEIQRIGEDGSPQWIRVAESELEHRAGDHMFDLAPEHQSVGTSHLKLIILENFGGSGSYVSKLYGFGTFEAGAAGDASTHQ